MTGTVENVTKFSILPGKQELDITREFDAPRELVFRAFTDAELYARWIGPRRLAMTLETFEPRPGGRWRYYQTDQNGARFGFHGVFHEVASPERIVETFEYEGLPEKGHATLETARFEALPGGRTRLKVHVIYQSVEDRDGTVQAGMEWGVRESYERLDDALASLA